MTCGVPHGSTLDPLLFAFYVPHILEIVRHHSVGCHQYANDSQLYVDIVLGSGCVEATAADVFRWFLENGLMLNTNKMLQVFSATNKIHTNTQIAVK